MICSGVVYLVTNAVTGKLYVGITTRQIKARWNQHVRDAGRPKCHFHRAIAKYGRDAFRLEIIERCDDQASLEAAERHWIGQLECMSPAGYNLTTGGGSGRRHSPETIAKTIARQTGTKRSPETREKIGAAHRGMKRPPGFAEKIRLIKTGTTLSAKGRQAISRPVIADGRRFGSLQAAAEDLGVSMATISRRIRNGVDEYETLRVVLSRRKRTEEQKAAMRERVSRPVVADHRTFSSLTEAAAALGMTRPGIAYRVKVGMPGYAVA